MNEPKKSSRAHRLKTPISIYRGYRLVRTGNGFNCDHQLRRLFPTLPTTFSWTSLDELGLRSYIDALYRRDHDAVAADDRAGKTSGHQFIENEKHREQPCAVSIRRLVSVLALTDRFDVPLWGSVVFVTDGHRLVPTQFIAELAMLDPEAFGDLDPAAEWHRATTDDLKRMGLKPEQVTSGMYRPAPAAAEPAPAVPGVPPRERTVHRQDHDTYIDWITITEPDSGPAWFTRRVYTPGGSMLYVATAWHRAGPWQVYKRNVAKQLALGLNL